MNNRYILVLLFFIFLAFDISAQNAPVDLFRGATLILPEQAGVTSRWVLPPQAKEIVDSIKEEYSFFTFGLDDSGNPVIGHSGSYILNPIKQYQMRLSQPFSSMVYMDNGAAFFATETEFGLAIPSEPIVSDEKGFPIVPFQPISTLPFPECSMFRGAGECLYFSGYNNASSQYEVYLLKPRTVMLDGVTSHVLSGYQKVFSSTERISAVTGDVSNCFVALGRLVLRISLLDGKVSRYFLHPDEDIYELAYSPMAGLIYSTYRGVGYAGTNGSLEFFKGPDLSINLRGDTLYLFFHESMGILALEHISGLHPLDLNQATFNSSVPENLPQPVIRFFSYSPPDYKGSEYADRFDLSATDYLACQADFSSFPSGMKGSHVVSARWFFGKKLVNSNSDVVVLSPGEKSRTFIFPMNTLFRGLYPGKYRVQLSMDGVPLAEGAFYVFGEVTGFDAILNHDTELLGELLENGYDPNTKFESSYLPSLLHWAALEGSVEDMRLLLQHGANVNQTNEMGETALFFCDRYYGDESNILEKVQLLIQYKIDVNISNKQGFTVFTAFMSSDVSHIGMLKALLEAGAKVNVPWEGGSPLLSALTKGSMDDQMLTFLLSKGARFTEGKEESEFRSALELNPNPDFVRLLLGKGKELGILTSAGTLNPKTTPSLLHTLLTGVLEASAKGDRPLVQRGMEVSRLLMAAGAKLLPDEELMIVNQSLIEELDVDFITPILSRHDDLLLSAAALNDVRLQQWIMDRLLTVIRAKVDGAISNDDLEDALKMCNGMRVFMEASGEFNWPEVYLYCGVLEQQLARNELALGHYKKFIELAPPGTDVSKVRSEIRKLE